MEERELHPLVENLPQFDILGIFSLLFVLYIAVCFLSSVIADVVEKRTS